MLSQFGLAVFATLSVGRALGWPVGSFRATGSERVAETVDYGQPAATFSAFSGVETKVG